MNNEDYASYELALKLKACGFDEPCNYGYSVKMRLEPEVSFGEPKMVHSKSPKNYNDNRKGIEKGLSFCSAPLLYQAQKWLRKVKHISVRVSYIHYHKVWFADWLNLDSGEFDDTDATFATYEEALADGISVALELIEQEKK